MPHPTVLSLERRIVVLEDLMKEAVAILTARKKDRVLTGRMRRKYG